MTDRVEHLIERAAAKLLAAGIDPAGPAPLPAVIALGADSATAEPGNQPVMSPPTPSFVGPAAASPARGDAMPALPGGTIPEYVPGPIPAPAPPLTRPVLQPPRPALTIPQGVQQQGGQAQGPVYSAFQGRGPQPLPSMAPMGVPAGQPGGNGMLPAGPLLGSMGFELAPSPGSTLALQPPPIVQLDALERAGMVVARTTRTRISEEYRIAIGRILRILHETSDVQGARNVVMVTSARPGEGKSFSALNLAGSIAQNGTDAVLLVDVDPKVKPLSDQLGLGDVQGFLDLVSDPSLRPEDLLRVTAIPNLAIMPVGTRLGGAAQTIGGTASMRPIIPTITRLARRFPRHLIMLDAPPCLSTSDPHTLAPHVGQVVLVVEAERTQRSEVEAAVDLVRVCPAITLLLNKVRMTTSHTFGAYDYFGSYT